MSQNHEDELGYRFTSVTCPCGGEIKARVRDGFQVLALHRTQKQDDSSEVIRCEKCGKIYRAMYSKGENSSKYMHPIESMIVFLSGGWEALESVICFVISLLLITIIPAIGFYFTGNWDLISIKYLLIVSIITGITLIFMRKFLIFFKIRYGEIEKYIPEEYKYHVDRGFSIIFSSTIFLLVSISALIIFWIFNQPVMDVSPFAGFLNFICSVPWFILVVVFFSQVLFGYLVFVQVLIIPSYNIIENEKKDFTDLKTKVKSLLHISYWFAALLTFVVIATHVNWVLFGIPIDANVTTSFRSYFAPLFEFIVPFIVIIIFNIHVLSTLDNWYGGYQPSPPPDYMLLEITSVGEDSIVRIETTRQRRDASLLIDSSDIRTGLRKQISQLIFLGTMWAGGIRRGTTDKETSEKELGDKIKINLRSTGIDLQRSYLKGRVIEVYSAGLASRDNLYVGIKASGEDALLPWELMYYNRDYLCLSANTFRARRTLDVTSQHQLTIKRVLIVASDARNSEKYEHLEEVEKEAIAIAEAIKEVKGIEVKLLKGPDATKENIMRHLRGGRYQALHFSGHSCIEDDPYDSYLVLENDIKLTVEELLRLFAYERTSLQLVFLNSCYSGAKDFVRKDDLLGLAEALTIRGIPYVIGMQWLVTDIGAASLSREFYTQLVTGNTPEKALRLARHHVYEEFDARDTAWAAPILYKA